MKAIPQQPTVTKSRKRRPQAEAVLAEVLGRQRGPLRWITLAVLVLRLAPIGIPILLRFSLDPLLAQRSLYVSSWNITPTQLLLGLVSIAIAIAVIRSLANYCYLAWSGQCGHALVADLRVKMYEHILRMPVKYLDRRGTGRVLLRFIGDSDALRLWTSRRGPAVTADRFLCIALAAAMLIVDWRLAAATSLCFPLVFLAVTRLSPCLRQLTRESRRMQSRFTGHVQERLDALRQSKWFDSDKRNRRDTRKLAAEIAQCNAARDRHAAILNSVGQLLSFLSIPLLLGFGIWFVWQGGLTIGSYVAFIWLAAHLAVTVNRITSAVVIRQKAEVSLERILRLLERSAERGRAADHSNSVLSYQALICRELVFCDQGFGSPRHPFSLDFRGPGFCVLPKDLDIVCFYEMLLGFKRPKSGLIQLDQLRIDQVSIQTLRQSIGWIPTKPVVFEGSVQDNIAMAAPRLSQKELKARVSALQFEIDDLRSWLLQDVGGAGHKLSNQDLVRIAISRASLGNRSLILVEDATYSEQVLEELQNVVVKLAEHAIICLPHTLAERMAIPNAKNKSDTKEGGHLISKRPKQNALGLG